MIKEKHLSVFCRYGEKGASSRMRFFRYEPHFAKAGIKTAFHSFFDDDYLTGLYAGKKRTAAPLVKGLFNHFKAICNTPCDVPLLIEYELFPMLWAWCDLSFLKKRTYFLNFDDPVWEKYAKIPTLRNKYDTLVSHAAGVIVANDLLAERFGKLNANIIKVPTAVDLERYVAASEKVGKFEKFTLVWIGNPATFPYLQAFAPTLEKMAKVCDFELLLIGKGSWELPGIPCRSVDWSEEKEAELLTCSHVGLMPLPDESFAKGKSAYKLIQYAASGIPALGSPVGENNKILRHGETGFLCGKPEEWCGALQQLNSDSKLYEKCSASARLLAHEWSIARQAPRVIKFIFG